MEYIEEELDYTIKQKDIFLNIIEECVFEIKDYVRKLIKERWLKGESVNGGKIINQDTGGGYASLKYESLKLLKNPTAGGNIDLTLTGSLGDKIDIVISTNSDYEIISTDSKYFTIGTKFGFEEFGLNAEEKVIIMNKLEQRIIDKINNLKY